MAKGFLLTLDAFLALILLSGVMVLVISQDYSVGRQDSGYMRSFSMDMLASWEKTGVLQQSLQGGSQIRQAVNALPSNVCARMSITNSSDSVILDAQKDGCAQRGTTYVTYRTFYSNTELYLARSEVWLK